MTSATYPSLHNRSVLVTGGGSGIGAAIVEAFAKQGSKVAFIDFARKASESLVETVASTTGNRPAFIEADLRDIDALRAAIDDAQRHNGDIQVLVNNAARDDRHKLEDVTPDYWDERMALNLRHQFFAAQAVYPMMQRAGSGSIINMGSISWMIGQADMPGYTTAKSAIAGLTRSLAGYMGKDNIRVNCIAPGWIMTERQIELWLTPEAEQDIMRNQCLQRKLVPNDIANVVLFFAADDSGCLTNQTYIADGGWM